ncbi:MAG: hypothetical protein ACLR23_13230 [Clostridia bacterium]
MAVKRIDQKRRESYKLFLFILPCLIFIFIFSYLPLRGWIYAFTNYKPGYQWKDMDWVGFSNFTKLFGNAVMAPNDVSSNRKHNCIMRFLALSYLQSQCFSPYS